MGNYLILSFCGGGIRGLMSAVMLERLDKVWGSAVENAASLLAGTSTGADLISQVLAGFSAEKIADAYYLGAKGTFGNLNTDPTGPGYLVSNLYATQYDTIWKQTNPALSTFSQNLLFTSFNVGTSASSPWVPVLYSNFANSPDPSIGICDAVVSSSAMPGMYGSYGTGNIDGAFVSHDPTLAAICLAVSNGIPFESIYAICFGTGFMPNWISEDTSTWGASQWQTYAGQAQGLQPLLINGTPSPILNASLNGTSTNLTQDLSGMLLGTNRYAYLNAPLASPIPENAWDTAQLDALITAGKSVALTQAVNVLNNWAGKSS